MKEEELVYKLKKKVVGEVDELLHALYRGYRRDYSFIMSEIAAIDMLSQETDKLDETTSLYILQFYLNNLWETSCRPQ